MTKHETPCVGYIQLTFFDDVSREAVTIGGAGFVTPEEEALAWNTLVEFQGSSSFQADRLDAQREIVDERAVSAETCERLMGRPIARLISDGRSALVAELAHHDRSRRIAA